MIPKPPRRPTFTSDWASIIRDTWPTKVFPHLDRSKALRWLEVGGFEGRSALWTIDHMFLNHDSRIVCVDRWEPFGTYENLKDYNYEIVFDQNTRKYPQIVKLKGLSRVVLPALEKCSFDGCYIDGCHDRENVLEDGRLALPLMKPGAIIVFDDYQWPLGAGVKEAVDLLIEEWKSLVTVAYVDYQIALKVNS